MLAATKLNILVDCAVWYIFDRINATGCHEFLSRLSMTYTPSPNHTLFTQTTANTMPEACAHTILLPNPTTQSWLLCTPGSNNSQSLAAFAYGTRSACDSRGLITYPLARSAMRANEITRSAASSIRATANRGKSIAHDA